MSSTEPTSDGPAPAGADASPRGVTVPGWKPGAFQGSVLAIGPFRRVWGALGLASLGDWLGFLFATALAQRYYPGSASANFAVSGVFLIRLAPSLIFGPFAGVVADRLDRRKTMVITNLFRALVVASIPFVDQGWWLFVATLLMESANLFFGPAKDASIPNLVPRERLESANSLNLMTTYGSAPLAAGLFALLALLGGILDNLLGSAFGDPIMLAVWVNAGLFLAAGLLFVPVRELAGVGARSKSAPQESVLATVWQGWSYLFGSPMLRGLIVGMLGAFAAAGTVVGLARTYVLDLGAGDPGYSLLFGTVFVGLALGMGLAPRVLTGFSRKRLFGLAIVSAGTSLTLLALIPNMVLVAFFTLCLGFFTGGAWVTGYTLVGLEVEDEVRGRTFAFVQTMARLVLVLVLAVAPAATAIIGGGESGHQVRLGEFRVTYGGAALTMLIAGLLAIVLGVLAYRRMDDRSGVSLRSDLFSHLSAGTPTRTPRGFFLALEGGEGTGKTTQSRAVAAVLAERGYDVVTTREPGGTPIGQRLRELLLDNDTTGLSDRAEALLYAADRADHVARVIRPGLDRGAVVLTDRYIDSSLAYQGAGRTLPGEEVLRLSRWATQGLTPALTVVLDLPPTVGLGRATGEADRLESEPETFHTRVREGFLSLAAAQPQRYLVVDASLPAEEVTRLIMARLDRMLPPTRAEFDSGEAFRALQREDRETSEAERRDWRRVVRSAGKLAPLAALRGRFAREPQPAEQGPRHGRPAHDDAEPAPEPSTNNVRYVSLPDPPPVPAVDLASPEPDQKSLRSDNENLRSDPGNPEPDSRSSDPEVTMAVDAIDLPPAAPPDGTIIDLRPIRADDDGAAGIDLRPQGPVSSQGRWTAPPS